ncbi:MAG TPA: hypothetical protein VFV43_09450 [Limnobacter sp.]|nr:hypothetical protein [Limnobacter sp.]
MLVLPLQSAWAAVHLYHTHSNTTTLAESVFHDHHSHSDSAHHHAHHHEAESTDGDGAEHHHHFHLQPVSLLTEMGMPGFPSPTAVLHGQLPAWQETLLCSRIERPNWC